MAHSKYGEVLPSPRQEQICRILSSSDETKLPVTKLYILSGFYNGLLFASMPPENNFNTMRKSIIILAAASMAMLSACCGKTDLSGKWEIETLNGKEVTATETDPFIEFDTTEGRVHGFTGCNIMNGSFTQDGNKLTFGNMATTMMAGPDMDLEREVLDAINATASVKKASDGKLNVYDAEGNLLMVLDKEDQE